MQISLSKHGLSSRAPRGGKDVPGEAGRVVGPVPMEWWASVQVSRFGVIPKAREVASYCRPITPKGWQCMMALRKSGTRCPMHQWRQQ